MLLPRSGNLTMREIGSDIINKKVLINRGEWGAELNVVVLRGNTKKGVLKSRHTFF